jgi:hypothetical protein
MTNAQAIAAQPLRTVIYAGRKRIWAGRILTGLSGAFLIFDACMKMLKPPFLVKAFIQAGYPESTITGIGATLFICTVLYLIPRTSIFGAVLLTGYLGGAVATNVRAETGAFNIIAPVICACIAWGGLWLRDRRIGHVLAK